VATLTLEPVKVEAEAASANESDFDDYYNMTA